MKIGLSLGYWGPQPPDNVAETIADAEAEHVDSIWTSEAYGSDALTPLAWWGARTRRVQLGTAIAQVSARTPTALAMAALTLDHLSGGRAIVGIGVSGPQVVEGWYGQPYRKPLGRTRDYVNIMRQVWNRKAPVVLDGDHYQLPISGGTGLGKALTSTVHPLRRDIPIYIGAEGPRNVALAAEIADGWIPAWFSPTSDDFYRSCLHDGFIRPAARRQLDDFDVAAVVPIAEHAVVEDAADQLRPLLALYIGGMGASDTNFHLDVFVRMGWADVCEQVQHHYLAGDHRAAAAAIPIDMIEDVALIGPADKIADDICQRWANTCLTTMVLTSWPTSPHRHLILDAIDPHRRDRTPTTPAMTVAAPNPTSEPRRQLP